MKKAFFLLTLCVLFGMLTSRALAQLPFKDSAQIIFGEGGAEPEPSGEPGGGEDGLGPGEFEVPFRCDLDYWRLTYDGHSKYSLDINRGAGDTDKGDPVLASADGIVYGLRSSGTVIIRHEGNYYTGYTHMQNIIAKAGDRVRVGQKIGEIGDVGAPGAYHLHVNHSKNGPTSIESNRIQVCYKRYGCDPLSLARPDRWRQGDRYNKGCP